MSAETEITVVIPTRHRNESLARCLDCLAPGTQTFPAERYAVYVTDDGSSSTAEDMVRSRYPWATWISGPRKGPASNRNFGARHGDSEWIAFTDDDCLPSPRWLQSMHDAIRPDTSIYEGQTISALGVHSPMETAPINNHGMALWSCNMMVRRATFGALEGFDETFSTPHLEDVDFRERALGLRQKIAFVPDAIVDHPPRRAVVGLPLAKYQESDFQLFYKTGHSRPFVLLHLRRMIGFRLGTLRRYPFSSDTIRSASNLLVELAYVAWHGPAWQKKYRERYRDVRVAYPPDLGTRVTQH